MREKMREALQVARNWIMNGSAPIGWNIDRIDADLAEQPAQGEAKPIGRIRREPGFRYSLWCTADEMLALEPFPPEFPVYTAPPAPSVPDAVRVPEVGWTHSDRDRAYAQGWNACRAAMLAAAPEGKP